MFGRVGVIPAAGKAERFGGYPKELLHINDGTLLKRTYLTMNTCDAVVVVTRPGLVQQQMRVLPSDAIFLKQDGSDLLSAVKTALQIEAEEYCFAMPDTYYPMDVFHRQIADHLDLGLFSTDKPERFGVYQDGKIKDKNQRLKGTQQKAWGVLMWGLKIARLWCHTDYPSFDFALNDAMSNYKHNTFDIDYYYDMATFEDYKEFLCSLH